MCSERRLAGRIVLRSGHCLEAQVDESLLQSLSRAGLQLESQCRQGYCGACRLPLLAGRVRYRHPPLAWLAGGDCLPCCAEPVGEIRLGIDLSGLEPETR